MLANDMFQADYIRMSIEDGSTVSRDELSSRAAGMFSEAATSLFLMRSINRFEVEEAHDVHGYYSLTGNHLPKTIGGKAVNGLVVHLQAYPGLSSESQLVFMGRFMDAEQLALLRKQEGIGLGNEHLAVVGNIRRDGPLQDQLPWHAASLVDLIEEGLTDRS